ncbi:hypothetical protein DL765_010708 [Monosporascus sp. GIB2]|nr:hypothetical protein DL765_010708 [Monosporascus sp. GIB2]
MASGKEPIKSQPEGFDMDQLMKAVAKLSSESKKDIHLDWKDFEFRLSEENRLRAAAVVANVKEGPIVVVAGLTRGTEMIKTLERSYGAKGIDQKMDLWT